MLSALNLLLRRCYWTKQILAVAKAPFESCIISSWTYAVHSLLHIDKDLCSFFLKHKSLAFLWGVFCSIAPKLFLAQRSIYSKRPIDTNISVAWLVRKLSRADVTFSPINAPQTFPLWLTLNKTFRETKFFGKVTKNFFVCFVFPLLKVKKFFPKPLCFTFERKTDWEIFLRAKNNPR